MSCNLLIVDDSPILRQVIRKTAGLAGVSGERVHEAGDGREALAVLDASWIDLVLLDLNMPVMDGEALVRAMRERPELAATRVVIVSTESNKERLDRLRQLGVVEFLRKPFEPEDLRRIVADVVGASG